jgi:chitodextrinase
MKFMSITQIKQSFSLSSHLKRIKQKLVISLALPSAVFLLAIIGSLCTATQVANAASCQPIGTTYGTDTMYVDQPGTSDTAWVRVQTPSVSSTSPVMLQVATGTTASNPTCLSINGSSMTQANTWTWVNAGQVSLPAYSAAAGNQTQLELIGTQPGVEIDNILLLVDGCIPTSTGTNCTTGQPAPTTPTLSAAAASSTSVKLSWTQSTDSDGLSVAGYYVFRGSTKIATVTNPATLTYTDTVTAGSADTYTVEAYDNSSPTVTSSLSNAVTITTGLTAPTNVTAKAASATQVNLAWAASTDNGGTLAGYNILRNGDNIASVGSTITSYSDKTVSANTTYSYVIQAVDSSNPTDTASSTAVNVTTPKPTPSPQAPTALKATATAYNKVSLSWAASTDPGGPGVAGYYIIRNGVTITQVSGASTTTYPDNSVLANTTYSYTIEAFDSNTPPDVSLPSTAVNVTTPNAPDTQPPTTPTNLKATASSSTQINLTWTASTDNTGVKGYTIYRNGTEHATVTTNSYGDTGLSPSTSYSYYVVAYDTAGNNSAASNTASATTQAATSTTITLEGTVTSASTKDPLSGVSVRVLSIGWNGSTWSASTNSAGQYQINNITEAIHSYSYTDNGYATVRIQPKEFPVGINIVNEALIPN